MDANDSSRDKQTWVCFACLEVAIVTLPLRCCQLLDIDGIEGVLVNRPSHPSLPSYT